MSIDNVISGLSASGARYPEQPPKPKIIPRDLEAVRPDKLDIGHNGGDAAGMATSIVYERAMAKLSSVVDEARAALGIPEGQVLDTSAEATANRIADFALSAFSAYRENHSELTDGEARSQFTEFIGAAINQGVEEARGILGALQALTPDVENKVNTIADIVQQRLDAFAANN
jgi:uncharacterized protein DUF5610